MAGMETHMTTIMLSKVRPYSVIVTNVTIAVKNNQKQTQVR